MAILQSCCCWRSLRKGSYASAIYTTGLFTVMAVLMGRMLHDEREFLQGNTSAPHTNSILEPDTITPASLALSAVGLCCATTGIITSLLLVYGIFRDNRLLLVPWIVNMVAVLLVDVGHVVFLLLKGVPFEPINAMLFTIDFFLLSLNTYSLLCVVSQYQEYRAGRGTAADQRCSPKAAAAAAAVRYAPRPTATSLLSSRRPTAPGPCAASPPSPPGSGGGPSAGTLAAPSSAPGAAPPGARKHVQFPAPDSPPAAALSAASADDDAASNAESGGGGGSVVELLWAGGGGVAGAADAGRPADTAPLIAVTRPHGSSGGGGILRAPKT